MRKKDEAGFDIEIDTMAFTNSSNSHRKISTTDEGRRIQLIQVHELQRCLIPSRFVRKPAFRIFWELSICNARPGAK
jgi:hypothetical protein